MKKRIFTIAITVMLLSFMAISVNATVYSNEYPTYITISGGAYYEVQCSLGRVSAVFPIAYKENTFGFSGTGVNVCNLTNSTVSGYVYTSSGSVYSARLTRQSTLEYQNTSSTWVALTTTAIYNTNVNFVDSTTRKRHTENYFLTKEGQLEYVLGFCQLAALVIILGILLLKRGN